MGRSRPVSSRGRSIMAAPWLSPRRARGLFLCIGAAALLLALCSVLGPLWPGRSPFATLPSPEAPPGEAPPHAATDPYPMPPELQGVDLLKQTAEQARAKSAGCETCHRGAHDPHYKDTLRLGCT